MSTAEATMINPVKWVRGWFKQRGDVAFARKQIQKSKKLQAEAMAMPFIDVINKGDRVGLLVPMGGILMVFKDNFKIQAVREDGTVVLKPLKDMEG